MFGVFGDGFGWGVFDIFCIYIFINFFGFGGLMFYKISIFVIVLNLIYELIEILFPMTKMSFSIKSFTLIVMLYMVCDYLLIIL